MSHQSDEPPRATPLGGDATSFEIPFPSEQFIEDYVWSHLNEFRRCPIAGEECHLFYRQAELRGYGITDIIKISVWGNEIHVTVQELKNEPLKEAHVSQLCRYLTGLRRLVGRYRRITKGRKVIFHGELAGPVNPQKNDLVYMLPALTSANINLFGLSSTMSAGFTVEHIGAGWYNKGEAKRFERGILASMVELVEKSDRRNSSPPANIEAVK